MPDFLPDDRYHYGRMEVAARIMGHRIAGVLFFF